MRRYKYIGRDGSSGYRTGKKYWGEARMGISGRTWFMPLGYWRKAIPYTDRKTFKADWE